MNKKMSMNTWLKSTSFTGGFDSPMGDTLYGLNHQGHAGLIQDEQSSSGMVFFTRPQLNLTEGNLAMMRKFYSLLTKNDKSIHRYVRCLLDPRLKLDPGIESAMLDNEMAFIPLMTNSINNMSGWPDEVLQTYRSKQGVRREQQTIGDGSVEIYESFDIDCTFSNMKDSPLLIIMQTWVRYINYVFEGIMMPYSDFMVENEIDYNTRIYRLVLDKTDTYVKQIASTGASMPMTVPTGKVFDFVGDDRYSKSTKEINLRFSCDGAIYNDPITVVEFNQAVANFNPDVRKMLLGEEHNLVKIPGNVIRWFNHRGYPIIDTETFELGWWISKDGPTYKRVVEYYEEAVND